MVTEQPERQYFELSLRRTESCVLREVISSLAQTCRQEARLADKAANLDRKKRQEAQAWVQSISARCIACWSSRRLFDHAGRLVAIGCHGLFSTQHLELRLMSA